MKDFKRISNKHLGELLVERGIIDREQVAMAMAYQNENGGLIGEILVELRFATEEDITQALTCQYGFPYLPLSNYEIDQEVVNSVPEDICRKYCLIPIDKIGKSLTVAMSNPLNTSAIENIEMISGCSVQMFVSTSSDIKEAMSKFFKQL